MVVLLVALVGLALVGRAGYLSFAEGERFEALAAESGGASGAALQERGDILSSDGRRLATSLDAAKVVATPYLIRFPERAAGRISEAMGPATGYSTEEIQDLLTARDENGNLLGYSIIGEEVDPDVARRVEALNIAGLTAIPDGVRAYPEDEVGSQVVGNVNDYGQPFGGVEASYDEPLRSGQDVPLTINSAIQSQLETSLKEAAEKYSAKSAMGLVMRVDNGEIIGLANVPSYDNNDFSEASLEEQRNRMLTDPYEPGSTFKAFTMSGAFEEGVIEQDDKFTVPDHITVADTVINDSMPHETETMTPEDILQESSNVGTIKIGRKLGGENIEDTARRFGFGTPTGVDLPAEGNGIVPPYETWSGTSIGNIPIGQGLTSTPLQLARGYAAIANGGYLVTPHVAQDFSGDVRGDRVISKETSDIVSGMLESVVERGTGILAQIPGYSVAGKTGTTQKVDPETGTYTTKYISSFIGFAPASDPEYLTLIIVDEPSKPWGEVVAAPAFKKTMRFTLGYYNVHPDLTPAESKRIWRQGVRANAEGH